MESSAPNRTPPSRPGRFRRGRAHDGYGHMSQADPSTCVMQALGRYFTGLTTPARGTICPADHGPFDPGFGQPAASR
jgi:hypothetical protein